MGRKRNTEEEREKTPFQKALELLSSAKMEVFHDELKTPCIEVNIGNHKEVMLIKSVKFEDWLCGEYFDKHNKVLDKETLGQLVAVLAARALHKAPMQPVKVRVARLGDVVYHYLADDDGTTVAIKPHNRIAMVNDGTVKFMASDSAQPLPVPTMRGGRLFTLMSALLPHLGQEHVVLLCAWLVGSMNPEGPYMGLGLFGPQGCGKTGLARVLKGIVDP